jgi:hypothetical protein
VDGRRLTVGKAAFGLGQPEKETFGNGTLSGQAQ